MSTSNSASTPSLQTIEDIVANAILTQDFKPVWNRLLRSRFYVAIQDNSSTIASEVVFQLLPHAQNKQATIHISEYQDKIPAGASAKLVALSGADIVRRAPSNVAIALLMSSQNFDIPANRVDWLQKSLEASRQAQLKKQAAAAMSTAPAASNLNASAPIKIAPVKLNETSSTFANSGLSLALEETSTITKPKESKPAATSKLSLSLEPTRDEEAKPVGKNSKDLDLHELKPRHVSHGGLGIELFVPMKWQEMRNDKALKWVDNTNQIIIEATGKRDDIPNLEKWIEARKQSVQQEQSSLTPTGKRFAIAGRNFDAKTEATVIEFRGKFQGDQEESVYWVCCVKTAKRLVSISMRIPVRAFEAEHKKLLWVLEGIESFEPPTKLVEKNLPPTDAEISLDVAPRFFSFSFDGRIGRLGYVVYSTLAYLPMFIGAVLTGVAGGITGSTTVAVTGFIASVIASFIFVLRPIALRMHDLNLSMKGVFFILIIPIGGALSKRPEGALFGAVVIILFFLALYLLPGRKGLNDFGIQSANTTAISVTAWIIIAVSLYGGYLSYKEARAGKTFGKYLTQSSKSGKGFMPQDLSFRVDFPTMPIEQTEFGAPEKHTGETHRYLSTNQSFEYMVQKTFLESRPEDTNSALDAFAESVKKMPKTTLKRIESITQNGYLARTIFLRSHDDRQIEARIFIAGKVLYILSVISPPDRENSAEVEKFFESFELR